MIGWRWGRGLGRGGGFCEGFGELAYWVFGFVWIGWIGWIGWILDSGIVV